VSVNYRLAPKTHYPAQLIDVKRALRWVKQNIEHFGGDSKFIAVGGRFMNTLLYLIYYL
jgi:acetyl esterase/lipase